MRNNRQDIYAENAAPIERSWFPFFSPHHREEDEAFLVDEQGVVDAAKASDLSRQEKSALRKKVIVGLVILALVFTASASISVNYRGVFYSPLEVLTVVGQGLAWMFQSLTGNPPELTTLDVTAMYPNYYQIWTRIGISFITVLCGILLAISGSLYQTVFRNPIAAPTMLGVSNGISMGVLVLVLQFGYAAPYMTAERYVYSYIGALAVLAIVLLLTRLASGKGQFSIMEMILVGSIVSQMLGAVIMYASDIFMDDDLWIVYQEVNEVLTVDTDWVSYVSIGLAFLCTIIPVFFIRYSANAAGYSPEEARLSGIDPGRLRFVCLACGTVMIIAAQIHAGVVSMITLVVPFVSRALFGTEFRKQFWGDVIIGAILLLICRDIVSMIPFVGDGVPIGTVVSFVTLPLYVMILAARQRGWE